LIALSSTDAKIPIAWRLDDFPTLKDLSFLAKPGAIISVLTFTSAEKASRAREGRHEDVKDVAWQSTQCSNLSMDVDTVDETAVESTQMK